MRALTLFVDDYGGIALHGPAAVAPLEGARREAAPAILASGNVEEIITVGLKGSGIREWIRTLEEVLSLAREGRRTVTLNMQLREGETSLTSKVVDGWIELAGLGTMDRDRGYQGLKLHLIRSDWWEDGQRAVKLQNGNGTDIWSGITIYNHKDTTTGHENFVDIKKVELPGSLPAPATISLQVAASPARRVQDVIIAGGADLWDEYGSLNNVLEGESGDMGAGCTAGTSISNAGASGGYYRQMDWTATTEIQLWKWTLIPSRLYYLGAKAYRPVIRLHNFTATAGIYLRWKIARRDGAGILEQTGQVKVSTSRRMILTPAITLPLLELGGGTYETVTLELWAECVSAGTKRLEIDFVQLMPVEEFAHLQAIGGTNENFTLVVDGEREQVYTEALVGGGSQSVSHVLLGKFINLHPSKNYRIYFLFETSAGMPVDDTLNVLVYSNARYRTP